MPIWHFLPILFDTFYRFYFTFSTLMADGIQAMIRGTHGQAEVCATAYSPRRQLADKKKKAGRWIFGNPPAWGHARQIQPSGGATASQECVLDSHGWY